MLRTNLHYKDGPGVTIGVLVFVLLLGVSAATAQVRLRFDPPQLFIDEGEIATLSIWLDDPIDIRTFEGRISYQPNLIESINGEQGQLFSESGFPIFHGFENDVPGQWHGFDVVLGSTDWVTGPGELFKWTFRGLSPGTVWVNAFEVFLFEPDASIIPDVTLEHVLVVAAEDRSWGDVKALFR